MWHPFPASDWNMNPSERSYEMADGRRQMKQLCSHLAMGRLLRLVCFLLFLFEGSGGHAMSDSERSGAIPPVYMKLKDLHLTTELVRQGEPNATILVPASGIYDAEAARIQGAIEELTGVRVPIAADDAPTGVVPIKGHTIMLGNRSTHRIIGEFYNRYYTLLDLRYPGPGGYVARSLHNPFGDGHNVIFVGGSDATGVAAGVDVFIERLSEGDAGSGALSVGWLMEIRLGEGISVPKDIRDFETWEASAGYGSIGYFGWNSISKRMAMYYMTGDAFHAREAVRLAFPDEEAKREITEIDGERVENKDEPLSGPYHYNAHMMILFWDLIEESPVFTDEERLRITNAFAGQFGHTQDQGWRRQILENLSKGEEVYVEPPPYVGSRHGQWSAISLYCLGRYFQKYYTDPLWRHCMLSAQWHFASLHRHAWVGGENDNLFWYNTGIAPILAYMLLTGDREPLENGMLATLLRGQEILASGREPDWALRSASIGFLHKAAYLMQDGRYLEYLRRTGMDLAGFRLGQSFWPEPNLVSEPPRDLVDRWSIHPIPEPMWRSRESGLPLEDSFLFGSFRSAADRSGDFILIKGLNGASRNPYHTFAVLELRLDGETVLEGFLNQVLLRAGGTVEPKVAMDAVLPYRDVIGRSAVAVGETPYAAFSNWRRMLVQRMGRYALIVDDLRFRTETEDMEVEILWQGKGAWHEAADEGAVHVAGEERAFEIRTADAIETTVGNGRASMIWRGAVDEGERRIFFSLVAPDRAAPHLHPICARLADNAAALTLPEPGVAVVGEYEGLQAELAVLTLDHLYGMDLREAGLGAPLLSSDTPIHVDWDFQNGVLEVVADQDTEICLALADAALVREDGDALSPERRSDGCTVFRIAAGRRVFSDARPGMGTLEAVVERLDALLKRAEKQRGADEAERLVSKPEMPLLSTVFAADVGGAVVDLVIVSSEEGARICAAEGNRIHVLASDGALLRTLSTDGPIRVLHEWREYGLLLAGCTDEKVIAFDLDTGDRRWVFVSEMDPAVFRAAKDYWFKSAPGHEGIHGLHTGVFLDGKSQAFVGSACTLEMLDENGGLVRRLPVFWGPGSRFALIDGPEESINLLIARQPTDSHALAVVNNRTLDPTPRSFRDVPPGHTNIGGWACMSRKHIFYDDIDGDGRKEVVSEINGTWNRVSVWAEDGTPLHSISFGPGPSIPAENIRDLDLVDLDGDGKKEILAATSGGYVVALDHRCEKVWSRRLLSPPVVMQCVDVGGTPQIVVGCEDGALVVLDAQGEPLQVGRVAGRPACIECSDEGVVVATSEGEVRRVRLE